MTPPKTLEQKAREWIWKPAQSPIRDTPYRVEYEAFLAGYRAAIEDAAGVADATGRLATSELVMGGGKFGDAYCYQIAAEIRALIDSTRSQAP